MLTVKNTFAAAGAVLGLAAFCWTGTADAQQRQTDRLRQGMTGTVYQGEFQRDTGTLAGGQEFIIILEDAQDPTRRSMRIQQAPASDQLQVRDRGQLSRVQFPQGIRPIPTAGGTVEAVRDVFAALTEAALDTDDIEDVIDQLAEQDRERLGAAFFQINLEADPLTERIYTFLDRWEQRYDVDEGFGFFGEFAITDEEAVFDRLSVRMGEVTDTMAAASGRWPVDVLPLIPTETQVRDRSMRQRGAVQDQQYRRQRAQQQEDEDWLDVPLIGEEDVDVPFTDIGVDVPLLGEDDVYIPFTDVGLDVPLIGEGLDVPIFGEQRETDLFTNYLEEGQEVAVVTLPREYDTPALRISMVHEFPDFWRIDIPDTISFVELKQNLADHIDYLTDNFDRLPAEREAAERIAGKHILMALYGIHPNPRQALSQYRDQTEQFVRQRSQQYQRELQRERVR